LYSTSSGANDGRMEKHAAVRAGKLPINGQAEQAAEKNLISVGLAANIASEVWLDCKPHGHGNTMAESGDRSSAPERLHALDAVRGFALMLGIIFHATISFVPSPAKIWIVGDSHRSTALAVLFFTIHVFRMTAFFLVAGFFAHMNFHRRGAEGFIRDRLKRIALPLLTAWPLVFAAILAIGAWAAMSAGGARSIAPPPWRAFPRFPLTHLWFLYVLLEFYAGVLVLRTIVAWIDKAGRIRSGIDNLVGLVVRSPLAPVVLAVPVGIAFAAAPKWLMWFGVPTPDQSFVTNAQAWIGFGTAFGFGWLLHRQTELIQTLERRWIPNLLLAIGLITGSLVIAGVTPSLTPIPDDATRLAGAACYALATWTATFAVIGLALRFLSGFSPARRYIADASYWIYIIHLPIVMALQVAVARLDWPWPAKFAAILAVGFPAMFASYQLLVRYSFIGAVLNGRRTRKPSQAATLVQNPSQIS
jgi:glucan biosynthesis protein C